jgi:ribosomal protein S25
VSYYTLVTARNDDLDRARSAALFNNSHLVKIVNEIAAKGRHPFTTRQIATATSLADSVVRQVIRRLLDTGFIEPTSSKPTNRGRAPIYLRVSNSPGWSELKSLCRKLSH